MLVILRYLYEPFSFFINLSSIVQANKSILDFVVPLL